MSVFRDKQMRWGVREGREDGRREKGLRALIGTEGREKQEDDKIEKREGEGETAAFPDC